MDIDDKQVSEFEDKYSGMLFEKIGEISSKQHEIISKIHNMGKYVDLESNLPNLGVTLNNKLVELQHQFQDAGISIYSQKVEDVGLLKMNYVVSSFVGDAIISDLINYATKGTQNLADYDKAIKEVTDKKVEQKQGLEKASPIRRFFARIRNFFLPVNQEEVVYTQEETDSVNSHLLDYKETDNELWEYNLRDNIVPSIVKKIREQGYHAFTVPGLLEENVIPDLEKLGLADMIPQLQQELIAEYKKDLPDNEIYKVSKEDMHLYVPDFSRESQESKEQDLKQLHSQAKTVSIESKKAIGSEKRSLRENGSTLKDFFEIDKTVSATERQETTKAIGKELEADKGDRKISGKEIDKKGEDISL